MPKYIQMTTECFVTCLNCKGNAFTGGKTLEDSFCEDCGGKPYFVISAQMMRDLTDFRIG